MPDSDVHIDSNVFPSLSEYVAPPENLLLTLVRKLLHRGEDLGTLGQAYIDLTLKTLLRLHDLLNRTWQLVCIPSINPSMQDVK